MEKSLKNAISSAEVKEIKEAKVRIATEQILSELDMKKGLEGYKLWIEAIVILLVEEGTFSKMYEKLAKRCKSQTLSVERKLRTARESILVDTQEYFKTKHKITNTMFLALLYDKVEKMI